MVMKNLFYFLAIVLAAASCSQVIEVDLSSRKPKAVINALFSPDSTWQVSLITSRDILADRTYILPITDAIVSIQTNNGELLETLMYSLESGTYRGLGSPLPGESYTVLAEVNGETFRAKSKVPVAVPIKSIEMDSSAFMANGGRIKMGVKFKDSSEEKNFYNIRIILAGSYMDNYGNTIVYETELSYEPVDPRYNDQDDDDYYQYDEGHFFSDTFFDGENYEFQLYPGYAQGEVESVRVVLISISEEYFKYYITKRIQDHSNQDPFSQPAQVFSNIENGVGIFAGYNAYVVELK